MPGSEQGASEGTRLHAPQAPLEEEPRLRYGPLGDESPRARPAPPGATRLAVSDKVLAVGHRDGSVRLLDHLGDQVRVFREHGGEVTDLCFDDSAEYLTSAAADGSVAVYGLYSEEVQRFKVAHPVTALALDPRYAARKTREVVYGTAAGALILSSKGWLGAKETVLYAGRGAVRSVRMAGTLLAWATDTGVRVYDTATHTRLGKLERPASAAADPGAPCSLLWRGGRELLVAWGRQVVVVRVLGTPLPPGAMAAKRSLQIAASFDAGCTALGAATFGADLAVLTWGAPSSSSGGGGGGGGSGGDDGSAVMCTVVCGSTAADELPVSSPVGGAPAADSSASPRSVGSAPAGQQGADGHAADVGQQDADQLAAAGQQRASPLPAQQEQELRLCFFTRAGQLLAADGLSVSVPAGQRRWHHLALLYPGDADLQLEAAVTWRSSIAPPGSLFASPPRSSGPGSVAGSGRSTPAKPAASTPVPGSPRAEASTSGHSAAGSGGGERGAQAAQQAVQQYKWWRDGEEPLYLISGPAGILAGRPRDGNDRVSWLAERGRYAEALVVADEDSTVHAAVRESVGERFLQALVAEERYGEAAALCPRALQDNELAWERWAYTFAQARQLAALAPVLPTDQPRLKPSTYDMVAASLLLHPTEHEVLLDVVRRWPQAAYNAAQLQAAVLERMGSSGAGAWPVLQHVAAHLYTVQGRHEDALTLQLQLHSPAVFDYIARHALEGRLSPYAAELIDLDEVKATALLVEHCEEVPPATVVDALRAHASAAGAPDSEARTRWRRRLHHYLDWLFRRDASQASPFAALQVGLYAEFEPSRLLHFLMVSSAYPLEAAYQVCERAGLVRESVYVLGRMGCAEKALRLIVEGLRDVAQAVEFVQLQRDDELWEPLIALTLGDAQLTGALLDHAGGYIDPLRVVRQIPPRLRVDNLRARLVRIITDFRTQMCLQQGCNNILRHDCIVLANRLYRALRSSLRRLHLRLEQGPGASKWVVYDSRSGAEAPEDEATPGALLAAAGGAVGSGTEPGPVGLASPAAAAGSGSAARPSGARGQEQPTQPTRVWVGIVGGPPPAEQHRPGTPQQHPVRTPSKFVWLASGASPVAGHSPGPRKLLVS